MQVFMDEQETLLGDKHAVLQDSVCSLPPDPKIDASPFEDSPSFLKSLSFQNSLKGSRDLCIEQLRQKTQKNSEPMIPIAHEDSQPPIAGKTTILWTSLRFFLKMAGVFCITASVGLVLGGSFAWLFISGSVELPFEKVHNIINIFKNLRAP